MFEIISNAVKNLTVHQDIRPYIKVKSLQSGDITVSLDLQQMRKDQTKCSDRRTLEVLFAVEDSLKEAGIEAQYRNGYKGQDNAFHPWPQIYCRSARAEVTAADNAKLVAATVAEVFKAMGIKLPEGAIEAATKTTVPVETKPEDTQQDDTPLP